MEVLYLVWKDEDERAGRLANEQLKALPLHWVEASEPLLEKAASIKARHFLTLADGWIEAAVPCCCSRILSFVPSPICRKNGSVDRQRDWLLLAARQYPYQLQHQR